MPHIREDLKEKIALNLQTAINSPFNNLTEDQRKDITKMREGGSGLAEIGEKYGLWFNGFNKYFPEWKLNPKIENTPKPGRTSKFKGVRKLKRITRYNAYIIINKKEYCLGYYDTELEAHEIYKKAKLDWDNDQKLPTYMENRRNKYIGVSFDKSKNKWVACFAKKKIGTFLTEEDAYKARKKWLIDNNKSTAKGSTDDI